ncbi:MAG: ATP-dependent helicase, partial [Ureaplasma sp.]|nr:ATP-dependent helicase [Ureaplasma sp.]
YIIDKIKSNLINIDELSKFEVRKKLKLDDEKIFKTFIILFELYNKKFLDYNYLDFNDIINLTNDLLSNFPVVRQKWSSRFDYILIDEFQDTNYSQFKLIENLANENFDVFAVGDEDQIIYTFRGADPNIISKFLSHNPKIEILKLEQNYRSTNQILNAANALIANNKNRIDKKLFSTNEDHIKPILCEFNSLDEESAFVAKKINELKNNGVELKNIAILYRSNYLSRSYEQSLIYYGIKYNLYGGFKFYQRSEIKDILAYLQVINNGDEMSLRRIINLPRRKISDQVVNYILQYSYDKEISFLQALYDHKNIDILSDSQHLSIQQFIELLDDLKSQDKNDIGNFFDYLLKKIDYINYVEKQDQKKSDSIKKNLLELKESIISFKNRNQEEWSLSNYLHEIALFTTLDDKKKNENAVTMSTIHSSKGLEYEYVFLVSFNDGIFPSLHSIVDGIEEERRLAYVAITRAKKELYLCSNEGFDFETKKSFIKSRFIDEIGFELIDKYKKSFVKMSDLMSNWFDSKNNKKLNKNEYYNSNQINTYHVGECVVHTVFGTGYIIGISNDILEISFPPPHKIKKIVYNHKSIKRKIE